MRVRPFLVVGMPGAGHVFEGLFSIELLNFNCLLVLVGMYQKK